MNIRLKSMVVAVSVALGSFMSQRGLAVGALTVVLDKAEYEKLGKDVKALYVEKDGKFHLDLPEGFEDVSQVKGALNKERTAREIAERAAKELAKKFEGLDADEVRKIMEKMGSDEERQLMKDGKFDEIVNRRMKKATEAHEKALAAEAKKTEQANARTAKYEQRVLDNHIRAAATKAGVHPSAIDDALFRARTIFKIDEEGNAVQLDADGKPVLGKDGKTSFGPDEWLGGMKESAAHWFPAGNAGGGATGSREKGGGKVMKRLEFDGLDPVAKATAAADARKGALTIVD